MGFGSGQDVLKAIALGAQGVLIGRAFVYGLGAAGQAGVAKALEILYKEIELTMALVGETEISGLGAHNLIIRGIFRFNSQKTSFIE